MKTLLLIITLFCLLFGAPNLEALLISPLAILLPLVTAPAGLAILAIALRNAPVGHEDSNGFHYKEAKRRIRGPARLTLSGATSPVR